MPAGGGLAWKSSVFPALFAHRPRDIPLFNRRLIGISNKRVLSRFSIIRVPTKRQRFRAGSLGNLALRPVFYLIRATAENTIHYLSLVEVQGRCNAEKSVASLERAARRIRTPCANNDRPVDRWIFLGTVCDLSPHNSAGDNVCHRTSAPKLSHSQLLARDSAHASPATSSNHQFKSARVLGNSAAPHPILFLSVIISLHHTRALNSDLISQPWMAFQRLSEKRPHARHVRGALPENASLRKKTSSPFST